MVVRLVLTCVDPGTCELQGFVLAACHLCALGCGAAGFWPLGQLRMLRLLLGSSSCFWLLPPAWGEQMLYSLIFLVDMAFWWSKLLHANWQIAMTCSSPLEMTKSIGLILFEILVPKMCVCVYVCMLRWYRSFSVLRSGPDVLLGSVAFLVLGGGRTRLTLCWTCGSTAVSRMRNPIFYQKLSTLFNSMQLSHIWSKHGNVWAPSRGCVVPKYVLHKELRTHT